MATVAQPEGEATPISLYVALAPERRADLEVISRAAIAWADVIREAAFLTDPFLEVRVELVSGTESSINLNSLIRSVRDTVSDPKKLRAIAVGVLLLFAKDIGHWVVAKGYDAMWEWAKQEYGDVIQTLSDDEKKDAERIVRTIGTARSTREKTSIVFRELRSDEVVTGVGVSLRPGMKPRDIVPRSEFAERAGVPEDVQEETIHRRTEKDRITLTLAAPELSGNDNKWKFTLGAKTIWARITDPDFNERIKPGSNSAPHMVTGIRMDVDLETTQELREGVWTTVEQTITKVHILREPISQPAWLNSPVQDQ